MQLEQPVRPPLAVWALTAAAIAIAAAAFGYDPFDSATWARWDSVHYESIARDGYDLVRCTDTYTPADWCGDAGWFPAYPWLVGGLHRLGLPLRGTAVVVSWLFAAATLMLLWRTFLGRRVEIAALGALVYAAWAPGQIYDYAVFPLSMLAFFTVAHLWLLQRGRYAAAGVTGAVAVLTYPLGLALVPVSALWLVADRSQALSERLRRVAWASGVPLLALFGLVLDQRLETGHWDAYLLVQEKYGHDLQNPIAATRDALEPLVHGAPFELADAPAFQTALVTAALLAVLANAAFGRRERGDGLLLWWAVTTWALPLSQAAVSLQRSQAALLPLAVLVLRLPRALIAAFVVAAIPVAVCMEKLFLEGKIT
jgi:hypothetical protein